MLLFDAVVFSSPSSLLIGKSHPLGDTRVALLQGPGGIILQTIRDRTKTTVTIAATGTADETRFDISGGSTAAVGAAKAYMEYIASGVMGSVPCPGGVVRRFLKPTDIASIEQATGALIAINETRPERNLLLLTAPSKERLDDAIAMMKSYTGMSRCTWLAR